jgi:hypothetical protein
MNEERSVTVSVQMKLSFEVEQAPYSNRHHVDLAEESAIIDLWAHLARYSGGRVLSINRTE